MGNGILMLGGALQSSTQSGCAQSAPVHPASHAHTPLLHSPRAEHSGFPGHTRSSHAAPPHTTAPLSTDSVEAVAVLLLELLLELELIAAAGVGAAGAAAGAAGAAAGATAGATAGAAASTSSNSSQMSICRQLCSRRH